MCSKADLQSPKKMKKHTLHYFTRTILAVIPALLLCLSLRAHAADYTTKFPKAERRISEGGHWITAATPGVNWHETMCGGKGDQHVSSVSTTPGYAFGPTGPARFGDALALLTGTWKPDQMAQATVRQVNPSGYPEVEIRLRTSPKDATGYEIMWSTRKTGIPYLAIATWDGPGSKPPHYTILKSLKGPQYGVVTGDVIKGMIVGHTITAYTNGKQQFQITDTTFSMGNPGFGFNEGPSGTYGISSFMASDTVPDTPATSSRLGATGTVDFAITRCHITASNSPMSYGATGLAARALRNMAIGVITETLAAAGSSKVTISATNLSGLGAATLILRTNSSVGSLPAPSVRQDVGAAVGAGSASYSARGGRWSKGPEICMDDPSLDDPYFKGVASGCGDSLRAQPGRHAIFTGRGPSNREPCPSRISCG
jgi:hypothetical protein